MRSQVQVLIGPPLNNLVGELAQLGERLLCTQEVSGSIPLFSTTLNVEEMFKLIKKYERDVKLNISLEVLNLYLIFGSK